MSVLLFCVINMCNVSVFELFTDGSEQANAHRAAEADCNFSEQS